MFYDSLKTFFKRFPVLWKFIIWLKNYIIDLSRLKDVLMMMILLHLWPEQTYRFSTRKFLPIKKNKFSKHSRPTIPYELLKSKSSAIERMKEINIIGRGGSFDINNLKKIRGPIFLVGFWAPLKTDNNGNVFYSSKLAAKWGIDTKEKSWVANINEKTDPKSLKEIKNENITYIINDEVVELFIKNGHNVLLSSNYATDKNGNLYPMQEIWLKPENTSFIDHKQCKLISISEKILKPPLLPPHPFWVQTGSFIPAICSLIFFADKINIYGWDFFLGSSPEKMSYWKLFFSMYNYTADKARSRTHFEEALVNFYYGYQFSKLPNVKIHGYMGQLSKHEKLIKKIEKVFFN